WSLPAIPTIVMPGLTRHPAFLRSNEEAGSRLKAGMTVKDGRLRKSATPSLAPAPSAKTLPM
ncbi:hypothetical protein, partial [Sphingobium sp.]|uniref:hypothetical protein n=1 Tax=Sphingobium sp. TaxID=1912891 RepID=UPI002D7EE57B